MQMLSSVLVDESSLMHIRNAAGLALKNALSARVWTSLLSPTFLLSQFKKMSTGKCAAARVLQQVVESQQRRKGKDQAGCTRDSQLLIFESR